MGNNNIYYNGPMVVAVLDCSLNSVTTTWGLWQVDSLTLKMQTFCLKDLLTGDDTIYLELLLTAGGFGWKTLSGYSQPKNEKNSP